MILGIVLGLTTLFYFIKFSTLVNARLNGEVFKSSARIYAAVPEFAPGESSDLRQAARKNAIYQMQSDDDASALLGDFNISG